MAQPRTHDIQRDSTSNEPVPGRAMAQRMSASPPLPGPRRFLIQTRPLDPIADVPAAASSSLHPPLLCMLFFNLYHTRRCLRSPR